MLPNQPNSRRKSDIYVEHALSKPIKYSAQEIHPQGVKNKSISSPPGNYNPDRLCMNTYMQQRESRTKYLLLKQLQGNCRSKIMMTSKAV